MAHVVECQLLNVDGHTYRLRTSIGTTPVQHRYEEAEEDVDWQEEEQLEDDSASELIDESLITQEGDAYLTRVYVDSEVLPFVIGKGGSKLKEIETATGASLQIPRLSQQKATKQQQQHHTLVPDSSTGLLSTSRSECITIKAPNKAALSSARIRVELQIKSAVNSRLLDYTHFISLPMSNEQTAEKLQQFQEKVLAQPGARDKGLEPSIFINPRTLHLTLLMLKLYSDEDRHKAVQTLQGMQQQVRTLLAGQPLTLKLSGLDHMTDDPTDIHVLYLKVQDVLGSGQRLQQLCGLVFESFQQAGLTQPGQSDNLKLHCTIINSRHRRQHYNYGDGRARGGRSGGRGGRGGRGSSAERIGFDGRSLLQEWENKLDLGEYVVPAVHLSQRGACGADGYYLCLAKCAL